MKSLRRTKPVTQLARRHRSVPIAVALTLQASLLQLAHAQTAAPAAGDKAASESLDQVVVTGSRIVRRDYEANSPIQTVDSAALENKAAVGIEDTLNKMPQFVPAATGYTQVSNGELINTGSTTTAGASTISLRGLGPNRNLVLIDGYRAVPVNATMAVDINTVPAAAIDRVEVITGGASSVYGADAVSGVVNFILKKNFQGVTIDGQYGAMQNGHAGETQFSALMGTNAMDGKGNVMLGVEYDRRVGVQWKDVDFYRKSMTDPTTVGTISIVTDPYVTFPASGAPSGAAIDSIFGKAPPNTVLRNSVGAIGGNVYLNQDGTVYTGASIFDTVSPPGVGSTAGLYKYNGPLQEGDFTFRKIDSQGFLQEYIPGHKANVPLTRYSLFGKAEYALTDKVTAYIQASDVESETVQLWQVSPATGGWSSTIPHGSGIYAPSVGAGGATLPQYMAGGQFGLSCPATGGCTNSQAYPVSPQLGALLDSRPDPNQPYNLSYSLDFPYYGLGQPRSVYTTQRGDQFQIGVKGKVEALDGTWDIMASHGTTDLSLLLEGYAALSQVRAVIQSPNYGKGFFAQANAGPPGNGFAGGVAKCTSGVPVFSPHSAISQDCINAMIVELQHQAKMTQDDFEANFQGHLLDLPAGEARFSVGSEYRKNQYYYIFDTLNTQDSFLDLGLGTFPANSTRGQTDVKEFYGELAIPVLKDVPAFKHLNLELGYRWSDYRYQGGISTWKALADWAITPAFRLRGGYQKATRAPNIAEMFQAQSQTWSSTTPGDPCGVNTVAPYGVNPTFNPGSYQKVKALCQQLMGTGGAAAFYAPGAVQPSGVSALWFVNAVGNPNVNPEAAATWTGGFVFQPRWENPLLAGFSATVDYYRIQIDGMIAPEPGNAVYQDCMSPNTNPNFDINNEACQRILRNPSTGGMTATNVSYINAGTAKLSGVDTTFDWKAQLSDMGLKRIPGTFGVNLVVSTLLQLETQSTKDAPLIDWVGSLGPADGTSLNRGAFRYRTFTTFNWANGDFSANMRWRHLPTAKSELQATTNLPVTVMGAERHYNIWDFSGSWNVNDILQLRCGIDNVFNVPPVITGRKSAGDPQPTDGAGVTEVGFYDVLGRQFYLGFKAKF